MSIGTLGGRRIIAGMAALAAIGVASPPSHAADPAPPSLLAAPPAPALPGPPRSEEAEARTYQSCVALAGKDPASGKLQAESWQKRGGAHPADHCLAIALVGLGQYKEAAQRFQALAQAMVQAPAGLRAEVLDQGAQAWLLAGLPARGYAIETEALRLKPDDPDLLIDRAEAAGAAGWYATAIGDLDRVLKADPGRAEALVYRASADRALGRLDPALADIERALRLAPQSVPALLERGNIRRLKGDIEGAREDWIRVAARAPGSAAAADAEANIARLRADDKAAAAPTPTPTGNSKTGRK